MVVTSIFCLADANQLFSCECHSSLVEIAFAVNTLFAILTRVWRKTSLKVKKDIDARALRLRRLFGDNISENEINKLSAGLDKIFRSFHKKYDPIVLWFKRIGLLFAFVCLIVLWTGCLKKIGFWSICLLLPFPVAVIIIWAVYKYTIGKFNKLCKTLEEDRTADTERPVNVKNEVETIMKKFTSNPQV